MVVTCDTCTVLFRRCGIQGINDLFRANSIQRNTVLDIAESQCNLSFVVNRFAEFIEFDILSFQFGAIYIRGKSDVYFYEYMQEVCGDALTPFMIFYSSEKRF